MINVSALVVFLVSGLGEPPSPNEFKASAPAELFLSVTGSAKLWTQKLELPDGYSLVKVMDSQISHLNDRVFIARRLSSRNGEVAYRTSFDGDPFLLFQTAQGVGRNAAASMGTLRNPKNLQEGLRFRPLLQGLDSENLLKSTPDLIREFDRFGGNLAAKNTSPRPGRAKTAQDQFLSNEFKAFEVSLQGLLPGVSVKVRDSIFRPAYSDVFSKNLPQIYFQPVIRALEKIRAEYGEAAVEGKIKSVVLNNEKAHYLASDAFTLDGGTLIVDHEPNSSVDDIEGRVKALVNLLEREL